MDKLHQICCPKCNNQTDFRHCGQNLYGNQKYQCQKCGHTFTTNAQKGKIGRLSALLVAAAIIAIILPVMVLIHLSSANGANIVNNSVSTPKPTTIQAPSDENRMEEITMNAQFAIAVKCVACFDGKYLLLTKTEEEKKGDASNSRWDLPGGRVNYKETTEDAARREMKEETSLTINELVLKSASTVIRPDGLHLLVLTYQCICDCDNVVIGEEHSSFNWFERCDIMSNKSIPEWIKRSIGN